MASPINAGLSLIEVMVCSALLVVGLEAAFSAMGTSYVTKRQTENRSLALAEAQTQVEQLQAFSYTSIQDLAAGSGQTTFATIDGTTGTSTGPLAALRPQVNPITNQPLNHLGMIQRVGKNGNSYCFLIWVGWKESWGDDKVELYYWYTKRNS